MAAAGVRCATSVADVDVTWVRVTPAGLDSLLAVDDAGLEHDGIPGDWGGLAGHEGSGRFWFWPPVEAVRTGLRVTVSTLWEAAWAELPLPR